MYSSRDKLVSSVDCEGSAIVEPVSTGRLPKASVFVHRSRCNSKGKRCVSDLANIVPQTGHGFCDKDMKPKVSSHSTRGVLHVDRQSLPPSSLPANAYPFTQGHRIMRDGTQDETIRDLFSKGSRVGLSPRAKTDLLYSSVSTSPADESLREMVPTWIPHDELRDWIPAPGLDSRQLQDEQCMLDESSDEGDDVVQSNTKDPCTDNGSRWAQSLRSISHFCKLREQKAWCALHASVQNLPPPTLSERLGIIGLASAARKNSNRGNGILGYTFNINERSPNVFRGSDSRNGENAVHGYLAKGLLPGMWPKVEKRGDVTQCRAGGRLKTRKEVTGYKAKPGKDQKGGIGNISQDLDSHSENRHDCDDYVGFLLDDVSSVHKSKRVWSNLLRRKRKVQ